MNGIISDQFLKKKDTTGHFVHVRQTYDAFPGASFWNKDGWQQFKSVLASMCQIIVRFL